MKNKELCTQLNSKECSMKIAFSICILKRLPNTLQYLKDIRYSRDNKISDITDHCKDPEIIDIFSKYKQWLECSNC